jgi:hypothetical protein
MNRTLPHPASDEAPKYWRYETGGELVPAIKHYLDGKALTVGEIALIRAYLMQWVNSSAWERNPFASRVDRLALSLLRMKVRRANTQELLTSCCRMAEELGMDAL